MNGSIRIGKLIYSFEQLAAQSNLSSFPGFAIPIIEFTRSWYAGNPSFKLSTSGSTGTPKVIQVSRNQMISSASTTNKALGLKQGNSALLCIDPQYIGGKMMLVRAFVGGLNLTAVEASLNPHGDLNKGELYDFAAMVPAQVQTLVNSDQGQNFLNSIDKIIIGGAAVDNKLVIRLRQLHSNFYSTYGMTETVSHIALKKLNGQDHSDSFKLLEGVEVALDDRGCLTIKGPVTDNNWITTNDLVELHANGTFQWLGRVDNVINSGGVKIQVEQLEEQIQRIMPKLKFMITSRGHEKYGDVPVMLIAGKPLSNDQKESLERKLPKYHCPKHFILVDSLPETSAGKIDRKRAKLMARSSS